MNKLSRCRLTVLFLFILAIATWSSEPDCTKIHPTLCNALKQSQSDSDSFAVTIAFHYPEKAPECRNIDPKQDTSGKCAADGWDSAYYAKLKSDAQSLFSNYEFWDYFNPSQRVQAASEGKVAYLGILGTKKTLIEVASLNYINVIESWKNEGPIMVHPSVRNQGKAIPHPRRSVYSADGKRLEKKASNPKTILIRPN